MTPCYLWVNHTYTTSSVLRCLLFHSNGQRKGDKEALEKAVQSAIDDPIGRYIPPSMTRESVRERHRLFVETDWSNVGRSRIATLSSENEDVSL